MRRIHSSAGRRLADGEPEFRVDRAPLARCGIARGRSRSAAGFTLVEMVIVVAILVTGILTHVSTLAVAHRHARETEEHGLAVATVQRFIERIRAESDWAGLWENLRVQSAESTGDTSLTHMGADAGLAVFDATTWYSGFIVPSTLQDASPTAESYCRFLIQVPVSNDSGTFTLREDTNAPRYGLPWDLNGDGAIDANDHSGDYRQLPIVVRMRWKKAGQQANEIVVATWLRGIR
jgi:prepilin-type N-terminal cleavage/methylation domain-containing protein